MPAPISTESMRDVFFEMEEPLRELRMLTELLAAAVEFSERRKPLTETAAWLIYEAAQRAEKAHEIYLKATGVDG